MAVRVTLIFTISGAQKLASFTETHWRIGSSTKESERDAAISLVRKRLAICGRNVTAQVVRLSVDGVRGDSLLLLPPEIPSAAKGSPADKAGEDSDQPNACLMIRLYSAEAADGSLRQKPVYLSGIPDVVLRTNPPGPVLDAIPDWGRALGAYLSELKSGGWGFLSTAIPAAPKPVLDYVQETGGTGKLGVVVSPSNDIANEGNVVQVRKATKINPGLAGANGRWRVSSELNPGGGANVTYFLRSSEGVAATNIDEPGTIELVVPAYLAYATHQLRGQTTRKRGASAWALRGSSSRRRS